MRNNEGDCGEAAESGDGDESRQQTPAPMPSQVIVDIRAGSDTYEQKKQAKSDKTGEYALSQSPRHVFPSRQTAQGHLPAHGFTLSRLRAGPKGRQV